jgi:hypothetical protein
VDGRLLQRGQQICRTLDERAGTTSNPLWEVLVQREMEAASEAKLPEVPPLLSLQPKPRSASFFTLEVPS